MFQCQQIDLLIRELSEVSVRNFMRPDILFAAVYCRLKVHMTFRSFSAEKYFFIKSL